MFIRILAPLLVLAAGAGATAALLTHGPTPRAETSVATPPAVRVVRPTLERITLSVRSQGTITPRTTTDLVSEIQARVVEVSPALENGSFFREGEVLARLEPRDFELAVARAGAALDLATAELEFARATLARRTVLSGNGIASAALLDEAQRAERIAEARMREAATLLERARLDLTRTTLRAPYAGRVERKNVDVGQFVTIGTPIARIYAVDYAEVRLPVRDLDLAKLDLPLGRDIEPRQRPSVVLRTPFAGDRHEWRGEIVRTDAKIDPRTRMVQLIARVPDPYAAAADDRRPPLAPGLFVEAEILGRQVERALAVPRAALDGPSSIWIVDAQDRLQRRQVEVLDQGAGVVWLASGEISDERITLSRPEEIREGLNVRPVDDDVLARRAIEEESAS